MTTKQQQWAHEIAPAPDGHDYFDENHPTDTIVRDLAKHHIARAWAFWQTAQDVHNPRHVEAMAHFIPEYQLAAIWTRLACMDEHDPEQIAVDVVTDLASPQVIGGELAEMLTWADIDPAAIRPFMAGGAA